MLVMLPHIGIGFYQLIVRPLNRYVEFAIPKKREYIAARVVSASSVISIVAVVDRGKPGGHNVIL